MDYISFKHLKLALISNYIFAKSTIKILIKFFLLSAGSKDWTMW